MFKKVIAVAAVIALTAGAAVVTRTIAAGDGASCQKPVTLLTTESQASVKTLEAYIATEIAPLFNNPKQLGWFSESPNPTLEPGKVAVNITVGEGREGFFGFELTGEARTYYVVLTRDCAGGDWKVVKFVLVDGQKPEPKAAKKGATA